MCVSQLKKKKKTLETRSTPGKQVLVSLEERIPPLPPAAPKIVETKQDLRIDDIVLIKDDCLARNH